MTMAVFPVPLSPMISSRCPLPIGIMASMALMPVCRGSFTGCLTTTPGALCSTFLYSLAAMGPFPSRGIPEGVDDPPHEALADRNLGDPVGPLDYVAFLDFRVVAEDDGAYVVFLQVQDHADDVVGEFDQLAGNGIFKAVNPRDTVADRDNGARLLKVDLPSRSPISSAL